VFRLLNGLRIIPAIENNKLVTFTQRNMRLGLGVIFLVALASYAAGLGGALIFDDLPNLSQNPLLQIDGHVFDAWRTAMFSAEAGPLGRPIALLSFALNHVVQGEFTAYSLKAVNLGLHLLTGYLIYLFAVAVFLTPAMNQMSSKHRQLASLTAMAVWLLHPLHVSTVLYVVQRMAQLSALFTVLGLWVFVKHRLRWAERGATPGELLATAVWLIIITALAAFSKENGLLLPWLLAVAEVTLFRGVWNGARNLALEWLAWGAFLAPLFLIATIFLWAPDIFTSGYQQRDFSLLERLMTQVRVLWQYLAWLCLPDIKSMGFHHDDIATTESFFPPAGAFYAVIAWLVTLIAALLLRHRFPMFIFALLFFLVGHMLESSVLALEMVYEHRNYLPSIGVCLLLSYILTSEKLFFFKVSPILPVGGALCVLAVLLSLRVDSWSDEHVLARSNVIHHPSSTRANYWYGQVLLEKANAERSRENKEGEKEALVVAARGYFKRAHNLSPNNLPAIVSLYIMDEQYFPVLSTRENWFSVLANASTNRVMQASDYAALSMLVAKRRSDEDGIKKRRLERLIDDVVARNPNELRALLLQYRFLVASDAALEDRIEVLEHARELAPGHPSVQYLLIKEYGNAGDLAAMYEGARRWLANDPHRRVLPLIKRWYVVPGGSL
jgi:hypothetical protein